MGSDVPEEQGQQSMHLPEQIARITCIVNLEVAKRGIDALSHFVVRGHSRDDRAIFGTS